MVFQSDISIIICCYNSISRISNTLESIFAQLSNVTFNVEVIVVDNNSSDSTKEVVRLIFDNHPSVNSQLIFEGKPGLSHAREAGINASNYPLLCFVDDDNELLQGYVQLIAQTFSSNPKLGILGGQGFAPKNVALPTWFESVQENFAVGPQAPEHHELTLVDAVYGAGFSLRKSLLSELKAAGFRSILTGRKGKKLSSGEDTELCYAARMAGYEIGYLSNLQFIHHIPKERINWQYVKDLNFGFGQSKVIVDLYSNVLNETIPNLKLRLPYWLDRVIHLKKASRKFQKTHNCDDVEGNLNQLKLLGQKGEIKKIVELKGSLPKLYQEIQLLYNNLNSSRNV